MICLSELAAWAGIGTLRDKLWRETIFKINAQQFNVSISSTSSFFFLQKTQPNIIILPNFENGKYLIAYACLNICLCSSLISFHLQINIVFCLLSILQFFALISQKINVPKKQYQIFGEIENAIQICHCISYLVIVQSSFYLTSSQTIDLR